MAREPTGRTPLETLRARAKGGARRAAAAAAVAALAYAGLHAAADRPAVERRLRARIVEALAARLGPIDLGPEVRVDWLFRVTFGPLATRPARPGATPALRVERVKVRPSIGALLAGRVEPASIGLAGVRIALDRATGELSPGDRPGSATRPADPPAGAETYPVVHFSDLVVALPGGAIEIGPLDGRIAATREGGTLSVDGDVHAPGGGGGRIEVRRGADLRARMHLEGLGPAALPEAWRGGAVRLEEGAFTLEIDAEGPRDLARLDARARLGGREIVLGGERLASGPVGPMAVDASGTFSLDRRAGRVTVRDGALRLFDAIDVAAEGEATLDGAPTFSVALRADRVDYRAAVSALPAAFAPAADAPRPAGTFSVRLDAAGPVAAPAEWSLSAGLDLAELRAAARRAPPVDLRGPFVLRPQGARAPALVVGPARPDFVPVAELPEHVIRAVTTSEDAGFFGHAGFDFDELRNAVAEGAEAGRVVRGGSTITQQLAKNLYLSPERTLSRKVREAFVTVALEATVPKARLLEIYLNVVEWGPGIRGIGPAARHWFGKDARDLTPREAAFLASIIPSPVRYHAMYVRGAPSPAWEDRVDALLLKMTEQGVLTDEELLHALEEPIVFARG
jgi:hypothetical protein